MSIRRSALLLLSASVLGTLACGVAPNDDAATSDALNAGRRPRACAGGLVVSAPLALDKSTARPGQSITGTVTYKNCTGVAKSVRQIVIAGRPPGGTHAAGPYDDFTSAGALTLAAGATVTVTASRTFESNKAGAWIAYPTYEDADGVWHDGADVRFTIGAAAPPAAPGDGYPTGALFRGVNRAGPEYGDDWDGWTGQTYYELPSASQTTSELAYFKSTGMNVIRLPISWERVQRTLSGPLTPAYVSGVMAYIDAATSQGFQIILDLHNYNRYAVDTHNAAGDQISGYAQHVMGDGTLTIDHLADVWVKLTSLVQNNPRVILNLMNEPHDFPMTSTEWFAGVQTVMNAIRATGSTHLILVPNSRGSDVTHWSSYAPNGGPLDSVAALAITDSANQYAFDMHAYLDAPSSPQAYADLVADVTSWAKTNGKKLFLSELGTVAGAPNGAAAVGGLLDSTNANQDVWMGWTAWDLAPYALSNATHTGDAASMSWYAPFFTPNVLGP